jgi:radical SAM superfamily enzyme YgiQ (UPF0313 family)
MSIYLVNSPSLAEIKARGLHPRYSYFEYVKQFVLGGKENHQTLPAEHMAFLSMKAYARENHGIPVEIVNAITAGHRTLDETLACLEQRAARHGPPRLIGFSVWLGTLEETLELARECRRRWPDARTLLGHDFPTLNYREILSRFDHIDFVCVGEGEVLFAALARQILDGALDEAAIPGLAFRDQGGQPALTPLQDVVDLDELPWASREELQQTLALDLSPAIFTTRGCPYRCNYCSTGAVASLVGPQCSYRSKSSENVVDEIELLVKTHGVDRITITDDSFVIRSRRSKERTAEIAREIIARGLRVALTIDARIDTVERDLFELLCQAGLRKVCIGIETASAEQTKFYRKGYRFTVDEIKARLRILQDLDLDIVNAMIMFHPAATLDELEQNLELIEYAGDTQLFQFLNKIVPYPGTPLYSAYRSAGLVTEEWPGTSWSFQDPVIEELCAEILGYAYDENPDFDTLLGYFRGALARRQASS